MEEEEESDFSLASLIVHQAIIQCGSHNPGNKTFVGLEMDALGRKKPRNHCMGISQSLHWTQTYD